MLEDDVDRVIADYDAKQKKAHTPSRVRPNSKLNLLTALGVAFILVSVTVIGSWAGFMIQRDARNLTANLNIWDEVLYEGDEEKGVTPGTIPGTFTVDSFGQAQYSMPIQIPPGTRGMEPQLSITYSSDGGNGILGVGFRISGLSVITRDAADLARDGYIATRFSDEGSLALDGQRLVRADGGTYTFDQLDSEFSSSQNLMSVEFRKQIDDNTRITAYGSAYYHGIAWFIVEKPDGIVLKYGYTSLQTYGVVDGRMYPSNQQGDSPYAWALSVIIDQYQNYIIYEYEKDQSKSAFWIIAIKYTGNDIAGTYPLTPYNTIQFSYQTRSDVVPGYNGGHVFCIPKRLFKIETFAHGQNVFTYTFEYDYGASGKSHLLSVTLYDATLSLHLPSTTFDWRDDGYVGFSETGTIELGVSSYYKDQIPMDVNGDGREDFVQIKREGYSSSSTIAEVLLSTGTSFEISSANTIGESSDLSQFVPADINGDGMADLVKIDLSSNGHALGKVWWSMGDQFVLWTEPDIDFGLWHTTPGIGTTDKYLALDVNGDLRGDVVRIGINCNTGSVVCDIWLSTGSNLVYTSWDFTLFQSSPHPEASEYFGGDINRDGREDLIQINCDIDNLVVDACAIVYISEDTYYVQQPSLDLGYWGDLIWDGYYQTYFVAKYNEIVPIDVNGDGRIDLIKLGKDSDSNNDYRMTTWLSNGLEGFTFLTTILDENWQYCTWDPPNIFGSEINGDGKTDVVIITDYKKCYWVKSDGFGTFNTQFLVQLLPNIPQHQFLPIDMSGDGKFDIVGYYQQNNNRRVKVYLCDGAFHDLLPAIIDGMERLTYIDYTALPTIYGGHCGSLPPDTMQKVDPRRVVSHSSQSSGTYDAQGIEIRNEQSYSYRGAKFHRLGLGFLGFGEVSITQQYAQNKYRVETIKLRQDYPCVGLISELNLLTSEEGVSRLIKTTSTSYMIYILSSALGDSGFFINSLTPVSTTLPMNLRYQVNWLGSTTIQYDYATGAFLWKLNSWVHNYQYDSYGNPLTIVSRVWDTDDTNADPIHLEVTSLSWENRVGASQWILGLPKTVEFTQSHTWGVGDRPQHTTYEYNEKGSLASRENEPEGPAEIHLTTYYYYDIFGNVNTTSCSYQDNNGAQSPTLSTCSYDSTGQFKIWDENALGRRMTFAEWDYRFGGLKIVTDTNDLTTQITYDTFGRIQNIDYPDNTITTYTYTTISSPEEPQLSYKIKTVTTGSPTREIYYDKNGRPIYQTTTGFNNLVITKTVYDQFGRIVTQSNPYFNGDTRYDTTYWYDILNRVYQKREPTGESGNNPYAYTYFSYNGFDTSTMDPLGYTTTLRKNALGQIIEFENALNAVTTFEYDASGNLNKTTDPSGIITEWKYDIRNRLIYQDDPNSGTQTFSYNALDHLIKNIDGKNQLFFIESDLLGRMTKLTRPDGYDLWEYDNPSNGVGALWKAKNFDSTGALIAEKELNYDELCRLQTSKTTVDSTQYIFSYQYGSYSRISKMSYPTGLELTYDYDSYGYNKKISKSTINIPVINQNSGTTIKDGDGGKGTSKTSLVWELLEMNAFGQITKEKYGNNLITTTSINKATGRPSSITCVQQSSPYEYLQEDGYEYDYNGNVIHRTIGYTGENGWSHVCEFFTYDELNRLTTTQNTPTAATIVYHPLTGNIIQKSDVVPLPPSSSSENYQYYAGRPNAVEQIQETAVDGSILKYFFYDMNGNLIQRNDFDTNTQLEIEYMSFNMPLKIKHFFDGAIQYDITYTYDAFGNKIKQRDYGYSPSFKADTISIDDLYEEYKEYVGGNIVTEHLKKNYIYAGGRPIALFTIDVSASTMNIVYLHTDVLGSVEVITTAAGNVIERFGYDAWGKRRNPDGTALTTPVDNDNTNRGFTGHKHVDQLGLIDMKARLYDPHIALFQSVDPLGGAYTYVKNNPLRYTDPLGLQWEDYENEQDDRDDDQYRDLFDYPDEGCWDFRVESVTDGVSTLLWEDCGCNDAFDINELEPITVDKIEVDDNYPDHIEERHEASDFIIDREDDFQNYDEDVGDLDRDDFYFNDFYDDNDYDHDYYRDDYYDEDRHEQRMQYYRDQIERIDEENRRLKEEIRRLEQEIKRLEEINRALIRIGIRTVNALITIFFPSLLPVLPDDLFINDVWGFPTDNNIPPGQIYQGPDGKYYISPI